MDYIDGIRKTLAKAFKKNDSDLTSEELTEATQRVVDRIVFVRFLEDKRIEQEDYVSVWANSDNAWRDFIYSCKKLDAKYNGLVFKRHFIDDLKFRGPELKDFKTICSESCTNYAFNFIPVHILGSIYERFLGKIIHATDKQVKVQDKPDFKDDKGVHYTPKYIVDYIVNNTVGKLITSKTPEQIAKMRFLDISCGSGSFLIGMLECLLDYHRKYYQKNTTQAKKDGCIEKEGWWVLSIKQKQRILVNSIYGVDIDQQAVEVACLSLALKMLEDETMATANDMQVLFHQNILPDMSKNIVCGNSLIGTNILSQNDLFDFDKNNEKQLNPMDYKTSFPTVMADGGFDALVGNPPYLNVDDVWGKGDPRLAALKFTYPHIYNDKTDILFYFLGRATELCKGYVSFIVSRSFLEAYKADKLRGYLISHSSISQIIDFQNFYVFSGIGITTCIITFQPEHPPTVVDIYKLRSDTLPSLALPVLLLDDNIFEHIKVNQSHLTASAWALTSPVITRLNDKIDAAGKTLDKILIIGKGMETGRNGVFGDRTHEEIVKWQVKSGQFYKRASNSDIQRFFIYDRGEYILYPQTVPAFNKLPIGVQKHLLANVDELKNRAAYQRGDCEWWKFTWALHEEYYDRKRIICPYLAECNRFALDEQGVFLSLTDTTVLFENEQPENLLYLLGVLNSKLLTFRFKSIGKLKSSGIYEYFWNSISKLSIRQINFTNTADKSRHDRIVKLVEEMQQAQKYLHGTKTEKDKTYYERRCTGLDAEIDALVYELYGMTQDEIKIVEGKE